VTDDLDAGTIIEQDTLRVSHAHGVSDFISKGRDLERWYFYVPSSFTPREK